MLVADELDWVPPGMTVAGLRQDWLELGVYALGLLDCGRPSDLLIERR